MVGGIYCIMDVGTSKEITDGLLGKEIPVKVKSIDTKLNKIIGAVSNLSKMIFTDDDISDYLKRIAKTSMSRRISARHRRDFLNDTVDLMHSMGVWVQKGFGKNGQNDVEQFKGGASENTTARKPHTDDPESRLKNNIGTVAKLVSVQNTHWYIVFAATMPYAVRLESTGKYKGYRGYGKRVLIGQFHTLINQFVRDSGMGPNGNGGVKFQKYYYGYIFESNKEAQIIEEG